MLRCHTAGSSLAVAVAVATLVNIGYTPPAYGLQVQTAPPASAAQAPHRGYGYGAGAPDAAQAQTMAAAANGSVHLDELMTLREWDASGVARLRPDERAALEIWVQRYRTLLLDSASSSTRTAAVKTESSGEVAAAPSNAGTPASSPPVNMAPLAPAAPAAAPPPAVTSAPPSAQPAYGYAAPNANAPQPTAPSAAPTQYPPPSNTIATPGNVGYPPQPQQPAYNPPAPQQPTYSTPAPQQPTYSAPPPVAPSNPPVTPVVPYPTAPTTPAQAPPPQPVAPTYPGTSYSIAAAPSAPAGSIGAVVRTGLSVRSVLVGNRFVSLTDGSMWDVYPADRPEAGVWHSSDPVYVRVATSKVSGGYDREIVNASRNVLVRARFAGEVSMGGNDGR